VRGEFPDDGEALLYLNNAYVLASGSENIILALETKTDGSRAHEETREIYRNIALAQNCINRNGGVNGKKIQVIPRISKNEGPRLISGIRQLVESTEVLSFIGEFSDRDLAGLSEIIAKDHRSLINLLPSSLSELPASIYSIAPPAHAEFTALGTLTASVIKPQKVTVIFNKDTQNAEKEAYKKAIPSSTSVIELSYGSADTNNTGISADIARDRPDLLVLLGTAAMPQERDLYEKLCLQLKKGKMDIPILMRESLYNQWAGGSIKASLPDTCHVLLSSKPEEKASPFKDYSGSYTAAYGKIPSDRSSAGAYDAVMLITSVIERKGASRTIIADYLAELGNGGTYSGASGSLVFTKGKCTATSWWGLKRGKDGKIQVLKNFNVQ